MNCFEYDISNHDSNCIDQNIHNIKDSTMNKKL